MSEQSQAVASVKGADVLLIKVFRTVVTDLGDENLCIFIESRLET